MNPRAVISAIIKETASIAFGFNVPSGNVSLKGMLESRSFETQLIVERPSPKHVEDWSSHASSDGHFSKPFLGHGHISVHIT